MKKENNNSNLGAISFIPLFIFLFLYIGSGMYFTYIGSEKAFGYFPRQVALMFGIVTAMILNKNIKLDEKMSVFTENAGNKGVILIGVIYLLAGGFQGGAKAIGGVDSVVNLGLTFVPSQFLIPGIFIISCLISTAIGTSMGTIAAVAPIAIGVAQAADMNVAIACSAVIGGAYFGDNLSIISDTTISATQGVGAQMKDKFKMNFLIALPASILAIFLYYITGSKGEMVNAGTYSVIKTLPYLIVLFTAVMGYNVSAVLFIGIIFTGIIGVLTKSIGFFDWLKAVGSGMESVMGITVVAILISGLIGLIKYYGGTQWLIETITKKIKDRKGAEYGIAFLSGLLSIALVNNTIAIIISAPIAKEIGEKYKISKKRLASLLDIFACAFLALCPYDGGMLIVTGLANVSPIEVLKYSFYIFSLILFSVLTIQFGLLKSKEERG